MPRERPKRARKAVTYVDTSIFSDDDEYDVDDAIVDEDEEVDDNDADDEDYAFDSSGDEDEPFVADEVSDDYVPSSEEAKADETPPKPPRKQPEKPPIKQPPREKQSKPPYKRKRNSKTLPSPSKPPKASKVSKRCSDDKDRGSVPSTTSLDETNDALVSSLPEKTNAAKKTSATMPKNIKANPKGPEGSPSHAPSKKAMVRRKPAPIQMGGAPKKRPMLVGRPSELLSRGRRRRVGLSRRSNVPRLHTPRKGK